jgi:hypothetical protein
MDELRARATVNLGGKGANMLDVHPPHEKMHGVKDFLLHLLTITIGLLIALGLEGCVEHWTQRELEKDADTKVRQEIRDNAKEMATAHIANAAEQANLVRMIDFMSARKKNKPYDTHQIRLDFALGDLQSASWKTAAATGALGFMDYDQVQRYAAVYQLQDKYSALQDQTIDEFLQLQSYVIHGFDPKNGFDPEKITPAEAGSAELDARRTLVRLTAMDQVGTALAKEYDAVLTSN